jgi:hypothetical protein
MIVHDFHVMRIAIAPCEADPPLVVDANAVLPLAVRAQGFQAIAGRNAKVAQLIPGLYRIAVAKFPECQFTIYLQ